MAFGSLVPGMAPMPIPDMPQNQLLKQGMAIMQQARQQQRPGQPGPGGQPGQPPQGLLQRLLNPAAPAPGAPMDLAAPGMAPNGGAVPGPGGPMQMGLLAKLFPGMMGQQPAAPMPAMAPDGGMPPPVPPNPLGGLY